MSQLHRLAWIDAQIRAGRRLNVTGIAERFEISRRQASRDVEYLRHSMGAPIVWSQSDNAYRYSDDSYVLPAVVVTDEERSALTHLADRYAELDDDSSARVASLLRRLGGHAASPEASAPPPIPLDLREVRLAEEFRTAARDRVKVATRYRGLDGVVVTRTMHCYGVFTRFGVLTCLAYCEETGVRTLHTIARFESVTRSDQRFEFPAYVGAGEWSDDGHRRPEPFVAVVRLADVTDAERLEGAVAEDAGTYRIEFSNGRAMIAALLACRGSFEILRPAWLRERLRRKLVSLLEANRETEFA